MPRASKIRALTIRESIGAAGTDGGPADADGGAAGADGGAAGADGKSVMTKTFVAGIVGGLAGGFLAALLLMHFSRGGALPSAIAPSARAQTLISAHRIQLVDPSGKVRAELAMSVDDGPALFFFDHAGRNRLVLGLYSSAEGEAPSVVLNDPEQRAAGIFRLFGPRDTPVIVLKSEGRDRSIYGLNPSSLDPFLSNYTTDGKKSDVFGEY